MAFWLTPDATGVGTHSQLGLAKCGMVERFGMPCPTCGYTTSFSLFAHGRWLASAWNQPGGFLAALVCGAVAWGALYVGVTGSQVYRLLGSFVTSRVVFGISLLAILAWAWKIVLFKSGG